MSNNLDDNNQVLKLNFIKGLGRVQSVQKKSLKIYPNQAPVFSNSYIISPEEITLETGETVVLEYTFSQNIQFENAIRSVKYYSSNYLQDINANSPISFSFNGVTTGTGMATLRMSIGRYHNNNSSGVSKRPVVTINGTTIATPSNWKGYDQASRSDFFGTIEIPVPMHLLRSNNTVRITFPDNGGKVAALILQVEKYDNAVPDQLAYPSGVAHPIPGSVEAEHYDLGGEGVAYHDLSPGNSGNQFRTDQVDIEITGDSYGAYNVGWISTGEWLEYTVNCATSANYDLYMRVASPYNTAKYKVFIDGVDKTGVIDVPNTGSWQSYQTVRTTKLAISAGTHIVRIQAISGGFNFNDWAMWVPGPSARVTNPITSINESKELKIYPNPTNKEFVHVEFKDLKKKAALQIFNVQGKLIRESILKDPYSQIDLHGIHNGVYLIKITEDDYSTVKKLIIQK